MRLSPWWRSLVHASRMQQTFARSQRSLRAASTVLGLPGHLRPADEINASVVTFAWHRPDGTAKRRGPGDRAIASKESSTGTLAAGVGGHSGTRSPSRDERPAQRHVASMPRGGARARGDKQSTGVTCCSWIRKDPQAAGRGEWVEAVRAPVLAGQFPPGRAIDLHAIHPTETAPIYRQTPCILVR